MRNHRVVVGAALVTMSAACAGNPQPVPVVGDPTAIANLAGRWAGSYSSTQTGRSGSIVFELVAGGDTAYGDVLMIPAGQDEPLTGAPSPPGGEPMARRPRLLTISFVQVGGDRVSGQLDPYLDPECGCELFTTFEGRVIDDQISGEYYTSHAREGGVRQGSWKVTRQQ